MADIHYLSLADVLALHLVMMEKFGVGPTPLRDEGMLESAIMRPRMANYYEEADIVRQAALLAVGVSQAQAFLDGNKRTALAVCDVFLRLNGLAIAGDPGEVALELEAIAKRTGNLEGATDRFEAWLRANIRPRV